MSTHVTNLTRLALARSLTDPDAFTEEHEELLAVEVEVGVQLPAALLSDLRIEPKTLVALGDLLWEEEPETETPAPKKGKRKAKQAEDEE